MSIKSVEVLWEPDAQRREDAWLTAFTSWLSERTNSRFENYEALWKWSVENIEAFWEAVWDYFEISSDGSRSPVLGSRAMPGAQWYPNALLNYAEHAFAHANPSSPALVVRSETAPPAEVSWDELRALAGALAHTLRELGIVAGDRVASYMPNRAETVIAFLACASIGAVWSSCSPDMGSRVVLDRLRQIEPKLLFAVDSYSYNGKLHDRSAIVAEIMQGLESIESVVHVAGPGLGSSSPDWRNLLSWEDVVRQDAPLTFTRLPFSHPLWIVYSSGTTGLPKAIVHGHGGIVLTHLKTLGLQHDLRPLDRLLFLGGTGWVVWNLQVGGLLVGATVVLYDGNPAWPDPLALWRFMDEHGVTLFGCGAAYLVQCMKSGVRPREHVALPALRAINSTGSPLPAEVFRWVYDAVRTDVWLASISGGTDIASGFIACAPTLPVVAGELQCRELGVAAHAFDPTGASVVDEVGELVVVQPMPSMPTHFWGDTDGSRYRESYFESYPGLWRQGDWIRFTSRGTAVIYGRSDATINRHGIRMGTAEIYGVVEDLPEIADALLVDLEYLGRPSQLLLFVVVARGHMLDEVLETRIKERVRDKASARHVPDKVLEIDEVPRTLTGKKMELPVRRLLLGVDPKAVVNNDSMANPRSLDYFLSYAAQLNS